MPHGIVDKGDLSFLIVAVPLLIFLKNIFDMAAPYCSVRWANKLKREIHANDFVDLFLHHFVINVEDIGIVFLSFVEHIVQINRVVVQAFSSEMLAEDIV